VLGAACISCSAILVQLAGASATATAFFRCVIALPVLAVLAVAEQRRHGRRPLRRRAQAWLAGVFLAIDLVLWNHAIADVGAGIATVLGNLQVLFVALIAWVMLRERPARRLLAALPVVLLGVVLASGLIGRTGTGAHPVAGIWYGLGTSAAYAVFLLILRHASAGSAHIAGQLADATAGAAVGALLLGLALGGLSAGLTWRSLGWLALLAISSQVGGWLLITYALPRLPAAVSSLLLLLQPAAALLLAAVLLGELPSLVQLAGALLICSGVLAVTRRGSAPEAASGR
jgi:drug/metabolite transporter (DMT)-like permease